MNKKTDKVTRLRNFFEERGFYIILFLCIGAIGISGYVLFAEDSGNEAELMNEPVIEEPGVSKYPTVDIPVVSGNQEMETDADGETNEKPEQSTAVNNPVPVPKEPFYVRPVPGAVLKAYSGDTLIKDETMGDWRVHAGVDFQTLEGERVSAVADGTVEDIYFDAMRGYCVRISHGGGIESLYCNLMKNATVKKGDTVKSGDIIGGVGSSMLAESALAPHLHLEMTKDGKRIDALMLLPKA